MRKLLSFVRAMRARGYRFVRHARGVMRFVIQFANGFGVSTLVPSLAVVGTELDPTQLASFVFERDLLSANGGKVA